RRCFFFQAEDGIRGDLVTGVQTCALPILPTCLSVLALMVPTCAIMSPFTSRESLLISPTATSTALSMPRLSAMGLAPAATVRTRSEERRVGKECRPTPSPSPDTAQEWRQA